MGMEETPKKKLTLAETRALTGSTYIDREAAGEYLGVSPRWLANNIHSGPPYHKVGAKVLYRLATLESWMKQQEVRRR